MSYPGTGSLLLKRLGFKSSYHGTDSYIMSGLWNWGKMTLIEIKVTSKTLGNVFVLFPCERVFFQHRVSLNLEAVALDFHQGTGSPDMSELWHWRKCLL